MSKGNPVICLSTTFERAGRVRHQQVPPELEGLWAAPGFLHGDDLHRHDHPNATPTQKDRFNQSKTCPEKK